MKLSYGLGAIALCGLQVALVQNIATAKPISEMGQVAQSRVGIEISRAGRSQAFGGVIIHRDNDLYSVLLPHIFDQKFYRLTTFDGQSHAILTTRDQENLAGHLTYKILQFRSSKKYSVAAIGHPSSVAKNSEIYVSNYRDGKFHFESHRVVANSANTILYDNSQTTSTKGNELLFNSQGELIGLQRIRKWSIEDEVFWPDYRDYPYPTFASLFYIYNTGGSEAGPPVCGNYSRGIRGQVNGMRQRYHQAMPITLDLSRIGVKRPAPVSLPQSLPTLQERSLAEAIDALSFETLDTAIQANPLNADLYVWRGNARMAMNAQVQDPSVYPKILADFDRALQLNPQDSIALLLRNRVRQRQGDGLGALADLDRLVALYPKNDLVYSFRGELKQYQLKDFAGALADYTRLVELNPDRPDVYFIRGLLKEQDIKDFPGALADYNQLLKLDPSPANHYLMARFKTEKLQDYTGALADYNRVISLGQNDTGVNFRIYRQRAEVRANLHDISGAMADYAVAIAKSQSEDGELYAQYAQFKIKFLKDIAGALADYNRAVEITPDGKIYYERGMFKATYLKDRAGAIADLRQALEKSEPEYHKELREQININLRRLLDS
jgi:tetratricopeptide (TPR) repeat protein